MTTRELTDRFLADCRRVLDDLGAGRLTPTGAVSDLHCVEGDFRVALRGLPGHDQGGLCRGSAEHRAVCQARAARDAIVARHPEARTAPGQRPGRWSYDPRPETAEAARAALEGRAS